MQHARNALRFLICSLIISATCLYGGQKLQVRDGRPIVDGVYVNGRGPYRFLIDTGSNVNFIETRLALSIGLRSTFRSELETATGARPVAGSDGNEVMLDSQKADRQEFVISGLDAIRDRWTDVQGVLGQSFLSRFDYLLDMKNSRLEFGTHQAAGTQANLDTTKGRQTVRTSFGNLILDSGNARLTLFGVKPEYDGGLRTEYRSLNGTQKVGFISGRPLLIEGRTVRYGEAIAIPNQSEPGVDGLLPLGLFKAIYFCNSEGYVVFD